MNRSILIYRVGHHPRESQSARSDRTATRNKRKRTTEVSEQLVTSLSKKTGSPMTQCVARLDLDGPSHMNADQGSSSAQPSTGSSQQTCEFLLPRATLDLLSATAMSTELERLRTEVKKLRNENHANLQRHDKDVQVLTTRYQSHVNSLQVEVQELNETNSHLCLKNASLISDVRKLRCHKKDLLRKLMNVKEMKTKRGKSIIEGILSKVFTPTQVKCLITGNYARKWASEDIASAIALRAHSRKAYVYLRDKLHHPLPSLSTLQRWCRTFICSPGIIKGAMDVLKMQATHRSDREKMCVVSFDEMAIDSRLVYDVEEDQVLGPHKEVQVAMVRGLLSGWMQPIFYNYDMKMTRKVLFDIVFALHQSGYQVVAIVSDMGGKNISLWKELEISPEKSYFFKSM